MTASAGLPMMSGTLTAATQADNALNQVWAQKKKEAAEAEKQKKEN